MTAEYLQQHWAIVAASVIALAVALTAALQAVMGSRRVRLNARLADLQKREKEAAKAGRAVERMSRKLERLQRRAHSVKPLRIQETAGELEDARALQKIADDQVLIARNQLRRIIVEEFPPKRHEGLRRRYLREDHSDPKPFTMGG